jgi:hypothetical protein
MRESDIWDELKHDDALDATSIELLFKLLEPAVSKCESFNALGWPAMFLSL